jgi:DNA-binding transcriptional ArsR family regulator
METDSTTLPTAPMQAEPRHAEAFKALSHLTRLNIFFYLVKKGDAGDSVGNIQAVVNVPGPTLSHHLDILQRAGLLNARREERFIFYSVQRENVTDMVRLLTACC